MSTFTIKHDTERYGETRGLKCFGSRFDVSGVMSEQAEEITTALSFQDAGLTDQYVVESAENTPAIAIEEYNNLKSRVALHDAAELATMAERERCAKIAEDCVLTENFIGPLFGAGFNSASNHIATLIRGKDHGCDPPQAETKSA